MTHRLLLIDDEAPKVIPQVFRSFSKDQGYEINAQTVTVHGAIGPVLTKS